MMPGSAAELQSWVNLLLTASSFESRDAVIYMQNVR